MACAARRVIILCVGSKASASSVEAFLSREAAEASAEESENETEGNELFDGMEAEERSAQAEKHFCWLNCVCEFL